MKTLLLENPDLQDRINRSESKLIKAVFPSITNHHNTLFGGHAMAWMDEVAMIAGTRFCRKPLVTVSTDKINFENPIPAGSLVELIARVSHIGNTSLKVDVNIYVENMYEEKRIHAIKGCLTFVALDKNKKPTSILP